MPQQKIVVGVDGSTASKAALRWALDQAQLIGARLVAITAWDSPPIYGWEATPSRQDLNTDAAHGLSATLDEVTGGQSTVWIDRQVVNGHPAKALLAESADAELLVLGNRGRGAFAAALVGSVAQYCTHHSSCPLVVVRSTEPAK